MGSSMSRHALHRLVRSQKNLYSSVARTLPDRVFLRLHYFRRFRRVLRLESPSLFTEKIQWLKLFDRDPLKVVCADKLAVRAYVETRVGAECLIPLKASGCSTREIDYSSLGSKYIVKTSHGSGSNIVVKGRDMIISGVAMPVDTILIAQLLEIWLEQDFSTKGREWEYHEIAPRILVEELVSDESGNLLLNDFKLHCFGGRVEYIQVISDRATEVKENWFDREWNPINLYYFSKRKAIVHRPQTLVQLLCIAESLADPFKYVRVDLYSVFNRVMFGEMTFHPAGGFMHFNPECWDRRLGELLVLPVRRS